VETVKGRVVVTGLGAIAPIGSGSHGLYEGLRPGRSAIDRVTKFGASMHGPALGATGAIEAAICILAFRHTYLPPTIDLEEPDPDCDLDYIPRHGRELAADYILSNSFGFGGINAPLVFGHVPA
jgi:3-oxoacyl-(acyl-carrier-protein) synthase